MVALTRWSPAYSRRLGSLDQLFESFFGSPSGGDSSATPSWRAPASIWEDDDHFCVEVELPGVGKEDIDVTVDMDVLRITAERKPPADERTYLHLERRYGRLERTFSLPDTVDGESVEAEYRRGVLHVKLAKKPESQPKKISVKSA